MVLRQRIHRVLHKWTSLFSIQLMRWWISLEFRYWSLFLTICFFRNFEMGRGVLKLQKFLEAILMCDFDDMEQGEFLSSWQKNVQNNNNDNHPSSYLKIASFHCKFRCTDLYPSCCFSNDDFWLFPINSHLHYTTRIGSQNFPQGLFLLLHSVCGLTRCSRNIIL